ncbi:MAG: RIP metalloprotease RseP [Gammaproteobacteria bacterium]|jgi:regulator of sigma E protease|nr:RIP metalloprotease RseP [Gammaproteobacteria bacterium]
MELLQTFTINILAMLVTLGILVTIHEFGHYWVARRCGVKIECFSIGFGKSLFSWYRGETEYRIAILPLGGYVKMFGERDVEINESEKALAFNHKTLAQKTAIVAAGPLANLILAVVLYWFMFMTGVSGVAPVIGNLEVDSPVALVGLQRGDEIISIDGDQTRTWQEVRIALLERLGESGPLELSFTSTGSDLINIASIRIDRWLINEAEPDVLGALGIIPYRLDIPAIIGELVPDGRAQQAGLLSQDEILSVNELDLSGWLHWVDIVRGSPEQDLQLQIRRQEQILDLIVRPGISIDSNGDQYGFIGAGVVVPEVMPTLPVEMNRAVRYSLFAAIPYAFTETWDNGVFILDSIKKMIVGLISVENLSGPITIAQVAGQTATFGLEYYLSFLAVLSISLGILNLLPIPVLDGGHLLYYLVEAIIRRPVPEKVQAMGMQLGIFFIVSIMFIAFYNDLNRLL